MALGSVHALICVLGSVMLWLRIFFCCLVSLHSMLTWECLKRSPPNWDVFGCKLDQREGGNPHVDSQGICTNIFASCCLEKCWWWCDVLNRICMIGRNNLVVLACLFGIAFPTFFGNLITTNWLFLEECNMQKTNHFPIPLKSSHQLAKTICPQCVSCQKRNSPSLLAVEVVDPRPIMTLGRGEEKLMWVSSS